MKLGRAIMVNDTVLVSSNVAETEAAWSAAATYAANDVVRRTVAGVHRRFHSVAGANLNNDPALLNPTKWVDEGPVNRWRQFDQRLQEQTTNADSIYTKLQISGRISALYLGNISAQSARVVCTDAIDGVVYDRTVNLVSTSRITDWARWFREPIVNLRDKGFTDLPSGYSNLLLEVTLSDPGRTVLCGEMVPALLANLGGTQFGVGLGAKSYSRVDEDIFGTDFITRRGQKRAGDFGVIMDNRDLDDTTTLLEDCDARAVLYVANGDYNAMFIFGLLLSWKALVTWPTRTALTLQIQSFVR